MLDHAWTIVVLCSNCTLYCNSCFFLSTNLVIMYNTCPHIFVLFTCTCSSWGCQLLQNSDGKYYICLYQVSMICFPVCHFPCRTILEDGVRHVLHEHIPEGFSWTLHILLTLVLCGSALGTSLLTSDLGTVSSLLHSSHVLNQKRKKNKENQIKTKSLNPQRTNLAFSVYLFIYLVHCQNL